MICQILIFVHEMANSAGENMWLRAESANENMKQGGQIKHVDGKQVMSVSVLTWMEALSQ